MKCDEYLEKTKVHYNDFSGGNMKLQNIKIGKRLAGGFIIFIIIIVFLCIISYKNMTDTDARANEITNVNFQKAMMANAILTNLQFINRRNGQGGLQ